MGQYPGKAALAYSSHSAEEDMPSDVASSDCLCLAPIYALR